MHWQQLTIAVTAENYEFISEFLENAGALAITLTDAADQPIYEPEPGSMPVWPEAQLIALFDENFDVEKLLSELTQQFTYDAALSYTIEKIQDQAWERVCMDQFQPICFNHRLWICPSWHHVEDPTATIVKLDPGLAFGTGSHPTTKLCLAWLAEQDLQDKIIIDYGCGSGILAIAALKLGAKKVYAIDIDEQALAATRENADNNNLNDKDLVASKPADLPRMQADIIIANILATPLVSLAPTFISILKDCGTLVLSGILAEQIDTVCAAYKPIIQFSKPSIESDWVRLVGNK